MPETAWKSVGREGTFVKCPSCGNWEYPHLILASGCFACGKKQQSITLTAGDDTDA